MTQSKENPLKAEKRKKLENLLEASINPFPASYKKTNSTEDVKTLTKDIVAGDKLKEQFVKCAGRVMTKRPMGKAAFFSFTDQIGSSQVYLRLEELSEEAQTVFKNLDIGDIIGIEGYVFKTKKGEPTIHANNLTMLTKTLEPLPEKYHGLTDIELKYRYRHLDLVMDPEARKVFETRSKIIQEVRSYLLNKNFLEVETPTLQPIYGGAAAKPFTTHHKALDMQLYLKISPELYLKRLIVGGFEKVFEIGKNFRNEGIDRSHNPEFTMLEYYEAYTDYNDQMLQFEDLVSHVCFKVHGSFKVQYQGTEIDFTPPWTRLKVTDAVEKVLGKPLSDTSEEEMKTIAQEKDPGAKAASRGEWIMVLFETFVEPQLIQPTFVMDFPVEVSPLTKVHREDSKLVERFEPYVAGMELGNAYSELNDPVDQRNRLMDQDRQRGENEEAHPMDEDFLHAIEVGMPPTGGVGIGLERLVMLLTDKPSIRDILLFPTMKIKDN